MARPWTVEFTEFYMFISSGSRQALESALVLAQEIRGPVGSWKKLEDSLLMTATTEAPGFCRFVTEPSSRELTEQVWAWLEDDPTATGFQIKIWRNAAPWQNDHDREVHTICAITRVTANAESSRLAVAANT